MSISNEMTVIALTNGMIGGIILVMPVLAVNTGIALIAPLTIVSGFSSYFSCLLCLRHLRNHKSLDEAIYYHFGKKKGYKIFYDLIILISLSVLLILYFSLICQQWQSMIAPSKLIAILNALVLFPIVYIMKKFNFGASLLAYGILSVVGYVIFLTWMWATTQPGPQSVPITHPLFVDLAAALGQGFAIQTFFIPILFKNPNRRLYKTLLAITYIVGTLIYTFIGYSGAKSIINRTPNRVKPETIEDYFENKEWQVITLQIIYLVHLYSAFPEFLLVAKKHFFSLMSWNETKDVSLKDVLFVAVGIFISLIIELTGLSVTLLIVLNGSIISFFFIYVIPIGLHLKCVYFTKQQDRIHCTEKQNNQEKQKNTQRSNTPKDNNDIENKKNDEIDSNNDQGKQENKNSDHILSDVKPTINHDYDEKLQHEMQDLPLKVSQVLNQFDKCDIQFSSKFVEICQLIILGLMVLGGLLIMGYALATLKQAQT